MSFTARGGQVTAPTRRAKAFDCDDRGQEAGGEAQSTGREAPEEKSCVRSKPLAHPRVGANDEVKFASRLVELRKPLLAALARGGSRTSRREDVVQQLLAVLSRRWPELSHLPSRDLRAYACRAAFRRLNNACRAEARCGQLESDWAWHQETTAPASEELLEQAERVLLCRRVLSALPRTLFDVVVARTFEGLSIIETATKLDIPASAVKSRSRRARKMLKRLVIRAELSPSSRCPSKRGKDRDA